MFHIISHPPVQLKSKGLKTVILFLRENVEQLEFSYIAGRNINQYCHFGKLLRIY